MFNYCPSCGSPKITMERNRVFRCPDCGFTYYHNTAAATACVVNSGGHILLLVRGRDPGRGKLDLPGGFVDPGEGAVEGLLRELQEELGWTPPDVRACDGAGTEPAGGTAPFTLFASFPNVYPYKNIVYNTCDLFFSVDAPGLTREDLRLEEKEIDGVRFLRPQEINMEEIAFESVRRALKIYIGQEQAP